MWRRILLLLLLAVVLAGLVYSLFRTVYRDYLLVRRYHEGLLEDSLRPEDIDADRLNENYIIARRFAEQHGLAGHR